MRVEKRDGAGERAVLTGMIVSRAVLGPIAARWEPGLFASRWANLAAGWAVEHYTKYKKAPGKALEGYYDRWQEAHGDRDTARILDDFLGGLSEEYERLKRAVSPDYLLDEAARLFNRTKLDELRTRVEAHLEVGEVDKAEKLVREFRRVEVGAGAGVNVLDDEEALISAFEQIGESLIEFPGALGGFFASSLGRDQFVSFMGKEKVGKSFWLLEVAWQAVTQGRTVAYFEVGDNSQHQVLKRIASRATGRPLAAGRYLYPTSIEPGVSGGGLPELGTERRESEMDMTWPEARKALKAMGKLVGPDRFKLSCHPNSSISVAGIESVIESWERDGWVPDVVVVDYADILAPLDGRAETRDQINASWKAMRALSQRHHCLVVTATQTDADSYDAKILRRDNFSEDKRKYAHVTGMVGINQTSDEKEAGLYRLNWVVLRELEFSEEKCVWTASCLPVCSPAVLSTF